MIAPFCEAFTLEKTVLKEGQQSLSWYPQFLTELQEDSQQAISLESNGTLLVAVDNNDRQWLAHHYHLKKDWGMPLQWLTREAALEHEPLLSPQITAAVWIPAERQVNNQSLLLALKQAFIARGGEWIAPMRVTQLIHSRQGVQGYVTDNDQSYSVDNIIIAAGAWANNINGASIPISAGLHPIKGQIIRLRLPSLYSMGTMIRTPRVYLAAKQDGNIAIGASSEDQGFDSTPTAGAVLSMLEAAAEVIPAIQECAFQSIQVGFRPTTVTHQPLLGPSSVKGLYHAVGHGRSGLLLAPYTAYTFRSLFLSKETLCAVN